MTLVSDWKRPLFWVGRLTFEHRKVIGVPIGICREMKVMKGCFGGEGCVDFSRNLMRFHRYLRQHVDPSAGRNLYKSYIVVVPHCG